MKYWILIIITIISLQCMVKTKVGNQNISNKQTSLSHELITGEWVETNSLKALRERDISEPHPFAWRSSHQNILTCFKDNQPFFLDFGFDNSGFLEKKDDYYQWMNDDSVKIKLQFSVSGNDTLLKYEYQFRTNKPFTCSLSKIPWATPCDFKHYPGQGPIAGRSKCYHHLYFKGKYEVREIASNNISNVEILPDFGVSGIPGVNGYYVETYSSPLLFTLYNIDTLHNYPIIYEGKKFPRVTSKNQQYFTLRGQENGFDLHNTNYSGKSSTAERRFQVLEKVYEFRRK